MCFIKLLKSLKTKSPKGKTASRKSVKKYGRRDKGKQVKKRRKIMSNEEKEVKTEETVETSTPKDEATKETEVDKTTEVETKSSEEETPSKEEEKTLDEEPTPETVTDVEEPSSAAQGVRIEDLVTKDELAESLAAMQSKLDAVLKENEDLKSKMTDLKSENDGLKEKYEDKDFGTESKKGVSTKNSESNETFESYSKNFM